MENVFKHIRNSFGNNSIDYIAKAYRSKICHFQWFSNLQD